MNAGSGDEELETGTLLLPETSDFRTDLGQQSQCAAERTLRRQACARTVIANAEEPGRGPDDMSARLREQRTYLSEGSTARPWLPLGSKPRGLEPQGSQHLRPTEAGARVTRKTAEAQAGATLDFRTHYLNTDNSAGFQIPRTRPRRPGIGTLRNCVTKRLPGLQETEDHTPSPP